LFFIAQSPFAVCGQSPDRVARLLGRLDEAVQEDHAAMRGAENHAGNPATGQVAADFPQPGPKGFAYRHSEGPAEFHLGNVVTKNAAVFP
jgi:hypothetical protein